MSGYRPYLTDDGSIGLFSGDVNDVFHSRYGALSEAYEKFIFPADIKSYLSNNKVLNVLDICYGIGYNTKSLIDFILKNEKNSASIVSIYGDKKYTLNDLCIGSISTDNIHDAEVNNKTDIAKTNNSLEYNFDKNFSHTNGMFTNDNTNVLGGTDNGAFSYDKNLVKENDGSIKINIDALEYEKEFVLLSPLIKNNCYIDEYKLLPIVDKLIYGFLVGQYGNEFLKTVSEFSILRTEKKFFNQIERFMPQNEHDNGCKYLWEGKINALLHNIYYRHISKQPLHHDKVSKNYYQHISKRIELNLKFWIDDARVSIRALNKKYDVIFLDAFTPQKLPTLWSLEFFQNLANIIDYNGVLLTYSNSARVRNAMQKVGFYIGKSKDINGNFVGTIASKNPEKILYSLSKKEEGLLNTKAGICYTDRTLTNTPEQILNQLEYDIANSDLITSSQYLKGEFHEV